MSWVPSSYGKKNKVEEKKAEEEEKKEEEKKSKESKDDKESNKESTPPEIVQGTTFAMHGHFKHDFCHLLSYGLFCKTYAKDRNYFEFFIKLGTNMQQEYKVRD